MIALLAAQGLLAARLWPRSGTQWKRALQVAAILRVVAGVTGDYRATVIASGVVWILAFGLLLLRYAPMLLRPRVDGRPG